MCEKQPHIRRRVRLEVDLAELKSNLTKVQAAVAPSQVMGVMKADAYGLGARPIAETLVAGGVSRLGVAELNEALEVSDLGVPVQILGGLLPEEVGEAVDGDIVLPITDLSIAQRISDASVRSGKTTRCHVLVDTGMGRLGILLQEAESVIKKVARLPGIVLEGIYTHFPVAYQGGDAYTQRQIDTFLALLTALSEQGITFALIHCANSDAVNNVPQSRHTPFNLVRTGLNLYGAFDLEGKRILDMKSVLTLKTKLTAVRMLPAGMSIGYGCTYTCEHDMLVGTISAGYADGLPLALSNRGYVLLRGVPCPVIGRISMDYTTIDMRQVPAAEVGEDVICLGGEGAEAVSVEQWAQLKGTHSYDIVCSFGRRVQRCYV